MKEKSEFDKQLQQLETVVQQLLPFVKKDVPLKQARELNDKLKEFDSLVQDFSEQSHLTDPQKKMVKKIKDSFPKDQRAIVRKKVDAAKQTVVTEEYDAIKKTRLAKKQKPSHKPKIGKVIISSEQRAELERVLKDKSEYTDVLKSVERLHKEENEKRRQAKVPAKSQSAKPPAKPPKQNLEVAKQNKAIFQKALKKYNELLKDVEALVIVTTEKALREPKKYDTAKTAALKLYEDLCNHGEEFFKAPQRENMGTFIKNASKAFGDANSELKIHRGEWFKLPQFIRGFLGVLATLTVIPAFAIAIFSKPGYKATFFNLPETESNQSLLKIQSLMTSIDAELTQNIKEPPSPGR